MRSLSEVIQRGISHQNLLMQKNSPKILFVGGVVGMVGSTVLACRSTLKLEEVLETTQNDLEQAKVMNHPEYSEQDRKKDITLITVRAGVKVTTLYAPSIILGAVSIAALTKSHNMLSERNAALTAAYVALDKGFNEYRRRVIDKYGEEQDQEFRYDAEEVEVVDEKGKKKKEKRVGPGGASIYARFFDEYSTNWSKDPEVNRLFLKCQQNFANDLLHTRGHLFLNEVYEILGLPHTSPGAIVGWLNKTNDGDGYVDFGVFVADGGDRVRDFVNGREGSVLLDFNVDGPIWDLIDNPGEDLSWQLGK